MVSAIVAPTGSVREFRRVPGLDGLRGVAVLLVLGLHAGKLAGTPQVFQGGFAGLDTFFVLSGFLITSILLAEHGRAGTISFRGFYMRRALRLLPALALFLAAHVGYTVATSGDLVLEAKAVVSVALYVGNFVYASLGDFPDGIGHTWSLAVEEQFYIVWPAALVLLLRRRPSARTLVAVALSLALVSSALRALEFRYGSGFPDAYILPQFRFDGLLIGVAAAFAWRQGLTSDRWVAPLGVVGVLGLAAVTVLAPSAGTFGFYGGYTLTALAAVAVLLAVMHGRWAGQGFFEWGPLRWIGTISYGLYLWHVFVMYVVGDQVDASGPVRVAIAVPLSLAVTVASWHLLEQPFLRLKHRAAPRPAPEPLTVPSGPA